MIVSHFFETHFFLVADAVGSLGALDSALTFLLVIYVRKAREFLATVATWRKGDAVWRQRDAATAASSDVAGAAAASAAVIASTTYDAAPTPAASAAVTAAAESTAAVAAAAESTAGAAAAAESTAGTAAATASTAAAALPPSAVSAAATASSANSSTCDRPKWPKDIRGMPAAQLLYERDSASIDLVCAFLSTVIDKVERMANCYYLTGETTDCLSDPPVFPACEEPSEEVKEQYRNPLTCGGIYYVNRGVPLRAVHPCTLDTSKPAQDPSSERVLCYKTVRSMRLMWWEEHALNVVGGGADGLLTLAWSYWTTIEKLCPSPLLFMRTDHIPATISLTLRRLTLPVPKAVGVG